MKLVLVLLTTGVASLAQQPQPIPFQRAYPPNYGAPTSAKLSTNNYQLELEIKRGDKQARYKMTLSGGSMSTELIDRLIDENQGTEPRTISFNASLTPFEDGGGEVSLTINQTIPFKTKTPVQGAPAGTEKEVTAFKNIPLMTRVALLPGKPVVVFDDGHETISLKLTKLDAGEKKF